MMGVCKIYNQHMGIWWVYDGDMMGVGKIYNQHIGIWCVYSGC